MKRKKVKPSSSLGMPYEGLPCGRYHVYQIRVRNLDITFRIDKKGRLDVLFDEHFMQLSGLKDLKTFWQTFYGGKLSDGCFTLIEGEQMWGRLELSWKIFPLLGTRKSVFVDGVWNL